MINHICRVLSGLILIIILTNLLVDLVAFNDPHSAYEHLREPLTYLKMISFLIFLIGLKLRSPVLLALHPTLLAGYFIKNTFLSDQKLIDPVDMKVRFAGMIVGLVFSAWFIRKVSESNKKTLIESFKSMSSVQQYTHGGIWIALFLSCFIRLIQTI